MRRAAKRIALGVGLTMIVVTDGAAAGPPGNLNLVPTNRPQDHVMMFPGGASTPGQTYGYWGKFTGTRDGNYRATCVWLADAHWPTSPKQDPRYICRIVLTFAPGPSNGADELVIQGPVRRPPNNGQLFSSGSKRALPITGGSGSYVHEHGHADIRDPNKLKILFNS